VANRWESGRTEAFSDGVFAIAITLLVLDLEVPAADFDDLWAGIAGQWPSYVAYATSFLTIGGLWLAHHAVFGRLRYANQSIMRINLLLLMAVSFLPFPTRLVAEAIEDRNAERVAVTFYGLTLLGISLLFAVLWEVAIRDRRLVDPDVTDDDVNAVTRAVAPSIGFYGGAIALGFFAPYVAAFGYLFIAIALVLRARGDEASGEPVPHERALPG
jgi:uncharacterized membrane protein